MKYDSTHASFLYKHQYEYICVQDTTEDHSIVELKWVMYL